MKTIILLLLFSTFIDKNYCVKNAEYFDSEEEETVPLNDKMNRFLENLQDINSDYIKKMEHISPNTQEKAKWKILYEYNIQLNNEIMTNLDDFIHNFDEILENLNIEKFYDITDKIKLVINKFDNSLETVDRSSEDLVNVFNNLKTVLYIYIIIFIFFSLINIYLYTIMYSRMN